MLVRSDLSADTLRGLPSSERYVQHLPRPQVQHPAAESTAYAHPVIPPWMVHRGASTRKVYDGDASRSTVRFERRLFFTGNRRPDSTAASQSACTPSSPVVDRVLVPLLDSRTHGPSRGCVQR